MANVNRMLICEDELHKIYNMFGSGSFTYHDLKLIQSYTYRAHCNLISDGIYELVGMKRRPPHTYKLSSKVITFLEKRQ